MITRISVAATSCECASAGVGAKYVVFPFYDNGAPVEDAPRWGMTLRNAGSMRFRWDETNCIRDKMLAEICGTADAPLLPVPLELIHSQKIYCVENAVDTFQKQGDGMITENRSLLPVVTVADCMPVFICDRKSGAFGVLHSGWKGTGIVSEAVQLFCEKYGADVCDIFVALGPHIHDCCYIVDEERASYFIKKFGTSCVTKLGEENLNAVSSNFLKSNENNRLPKYRLSLEAANIIILKKIGVPEKHVTVAIDCTCCCEVFGSFRREACGHDGAKLQEMTKLMTVQAAFCGYVGKASAIK